MKPAWSDAFEPDRLGPAPVLELAEAITREWAYGDGSGAGVKVGVVDSGIDGDHPLVGGVQGGVIVELDPEATDEVRFDVGAHTDLFGHGTACAGLIRRLAPAVELYSVRVLGKRLTGSGVCFLQGLQWCVDNGMHVVNLSLSTAKSDFFSTFHEVCDVAAFRRVLLVSALSNEPKASYPSQFSTVFSVAATDGQDAETFACNPSPPAEWGAPGIDVEVPWLEGETIVATGNSFAAPIIAGHLCRILGAHPGLTPWQAKTVLAALAENAPMASRQ